jgi:NAD(P)-dependent dehydrogenase (short-subunit alcohol dehydrogenase family)
MPTPAPCSPGKDFCEAHATPPARRAGKCVLAPAELMPIEVFEDQLQVNLVGALRLTQVGAVLGRPPAARNYAWCVRVCEESEVSKGEGHGACVITRYAPAPCLVACRRSCRCCVRGGRAPTQGPWSPAAWSTSPARPAPSRSPCSVRLPHPATHLIPPYLPTFPFHTHVQLSFARWATRPRMLPPHRTHAHTCTNALNSLAHAHAGAYCASKFALEGWSDSLRYEPLLSALPLAPPSKPLPPSLPHRFAAAPPATCCARPSSYPRHVPSEGVGPTMPYHLRTVLLLHCTHAGTSSRHRVSRCGQAPPPSGAGLEACSGRVHPMQVLGWLPRLI